MPEEVYRLPEIVKLEDFGGDFSAFFEAVYEQFRQDFVVRRPVFEGRRLGLKAHPLVDGREYTFYHITHDGNDEANRSPNLRRMERIAWPAPLINDSKNSYLKVWRNKRGRHDRILIFHEEESYLVVLEDRVDYILPWTAYLVEYDFKKRKLLKEYQDYKKAEAAQGR